MRYYAVLYEANIDNYKIIWREAGEDVWYVYVPDAGDSATANTIMQALNLAEK